MFQLWEDQAVTVSRSGGAGVLSELLCPCSDDQADLPAVYFVHTHMTLHSLQSPLVSVVSIWILPWASSQGARNCRPYARQEPTEEMGILPAWERQGRAELLGEQVTKTQVERHRVIKNQALTTLYAAPSTCTCSQTCWRYDWHALHYSWPLGSTA